MTIEQSAQIVLKAPIEVVFPLFGPIEEKKWARGWDPKVLYPKGKDFTEGMVFRTPSTNSKEDWFYWTLACLQDLHLVRYLVSTSNRLWTINIVFSKDANQHTAALVGYRYTGFNETGKLLNQDALKEMFKYNLKDWERAVNHYLSTGKCLEE